MNLERAILKRFESLAQEAIQKGFVRTIEFSGPTYQIEVFDRDLQESYWPFLQFNGKGKLKDAFCSCDQMTEKEGCVHLAAALLKVYGKEHRPLHIRFEKSLWNALGRLLADTLGYDSSSLVKRGKGHYLKLPFFEIKAKNPQAKETLSHFIEHRRKESEENSLKFSSLSLEEITHWREGRASFELLYELSFWSDIAKWLFLFQENGLVPSVSFLYLNSPLPVGIKAVLKGEVELSVRFDSPGLITLIEPLTTVVSPLPLFRAEDEAIRSIRFDPERMSFQIEKTEKRSKQVSKDRIPLGPYDFIPKVGFFERKSRLPLEFPMVEKEQVEPFLMEHLDLIKKHLVDYKIHEKKRRMHYSLYFDENWALHIKGYLFDRDESPAQLFGSFAFVEGKGFYLLEGVAFSEASIVIPPLEVSQFVNEHRTFFNEQEGFETHLFALETSLLYEVTPGQNLRFFNPLLKEGQRGQDFGDWIYLKGEGFFSKRKIGSSLKVEASLEIARELVPFFIETHKEELESVNGFYASQSPLNKRGLNVALNERGEIVVSPQYVPLEEYRSAALSFFGDYVYIPGEGFYLLPLEHHLPERFSRAVVIDKELVPYFLRHEFGGIKAKTLFIDPRLHPVGQFELEVESLKKKEEGGFEGKIFYRTEGGKISLAALKKAMSQKKDFLFLEKGIIDLEDERLRWIHRLKGATSSETGTVEFSPIEWMRLLVSERLFLPPDETPEIIKTKALLEELREFKTPDPPNYSDLQSELRAYQQKGVEWLWFLYTNGLAGLLCDEMGLGKTHQALGLIASIASKKQKGLFLVICPTSVIYHWEDKFNRFLPSLPVRTFHRYKRSLKKLPKKGIVLTSYGVVRSEKEALQELDFELAIFDEIQVAKNPHSRIHSALASLKAKMRLGLTGTPIENNLHEIKALFDLVLPTFFPPEKTYKEMFVLPIEREGSDEKKELLRSLIHPFMLRRRKKEVLEELPDKTVEKGYCELSVEQQELYAGVLKQGREGIIKELQEEKGGGLPYVHIFALISHLKQICDHPALFFKDPQNYKKYGSGKWDLFVELLDEVRESEQKVVVFSQYLQMLDIIALYVKEKGWGYAMLKGDTVNRGAEVARFQEDPSCVVFIGSLGAAGVGIDLTAANQVILYDRWWNPARENQAIDRVHRIGQKWGVQVFKLITKNTIEERIDQLVEKKQKLFEEIISADDQQVVKSLSLNELLSLLSM